MSWWHRAIDAVAPGVGLLVQKAGESNKDKGYGIQGPTSDFHPSQIDPSLTQDASDPADGWANDKAGAGYTKAPQGWDMTTPGVAEQYQQSNQGKMLGPGRTDQAYDKVSQAYGSPGQGEQYWNQVAGKFNGGTNAQGAYDRAAGQSADPGLGAYYDRAKQQTSNTMNDQLAAMGLLGSSVGAQQMGNAISGLDAERANREADFMLRQNQMLGQLGASADSQNHGMWGLGAQMSGQAQQLGLARGTQMFNAAQGADAADMARFNAGMNAAQAAQDARRTRGQDMFGNVYGPAAAMAGVVGQAQNDVLGNDQQYMDAAMAAEMGIPRSQIDYSQYKADRQKDDERHAMDMTQKIMSMSAGGGGMGGMMGGGGGGK